MTTIAAQSTIIRRILRDSPDEDYLTAAITTSGATTMTVNDVSKWVKGSVWEFDDGGTSGAEQILVRSVDTSTSTITIKRGHGGSTATTHSSACVILRGPRFPFDTVSQAVSTAIDVDLFGEGVYEIVEHQVTSSSTTSAYNAPTTSCEEFLNVYQRVNANDSPQRINDFTRLPKNVDTALWANGKVFEIRGNYGVPGTELYYVNCKHRLAIGTLSTQHERIVQWLACAYLLEWGEPRRIAGPNNQGDITVKPGVGVGTAAYYRSLAATAIANERQTLKVLNPPFRTFQRN